MPAVANERAFEAAIELALTGHTREGLSAGSHLAEALGHMRGGNGFYLGTPSAYQPQYAIDGVRFWDFLEKTQAHELDKLRRRRADWQVAILSRFDNQIRKHGLLHLLNNGLPVEDAHLQLLYPLPTAASGRETHEKFEANQFSVTRQVHYSTTNAADSVDMVLFVNGLALCTLELKNAWTGQNARRHGQEQYRARDTSQALFQPARCLVHFAVDTEEVYMTTRVAGAATTFLPFNKGNDHGAGNPVNPTGHRTAYLWQEVFTRQSLANIIQQFVRLGGNEKDPLAKRSLYFPRYHQLDVVRQLVADATAHGVGRKYLIQHSAGSGKSNSITWAAYQLIDVYAPAGVPGGKGPDTPLFNTVIVVTDRRLLDKQLSGNIRAFSQVKGIVAHAHSSQDLRVALEQGKRIVITTLQKFPYIIDGIADLRDRNFAVIIDEAHSSQGGSAASDMNRAMSGGDPDETDPQERVLKAIQDRKFQNNASYFAFTATPKNSTLEMFGTRQPDGRFRPFHLYSMKQAIEEGFILDVLHNYTTYRSYYEIKKSVDDDPLFDSKKAQKKLRHYVEIHQSTIAVKAEIMLDHFMDQVIKPKKLQNKAKGMVVTQSIEAAIRYYQALRTLLEKKGNPFRIAIAFSGEKELDGIKYTEDSINNFPALPDTGEGITDRIARHFDGDEYRLLVVANKYLTGFDQPKLTAMYVDKKLEGVLAVQALSRLNRSAPWLGKRKEDLFILDFYNEVGDIKAAFDPFYTATSLSSATDVNVLHDLADQLEAVGVFSWEEVANFTDQFLAGADAERVLSPLLQPAEDRFQSELGLDYAAQADFKVKAKQYLKIYSQVAAILQFNIIRWEQLYWYLKFLVPRLRLQDPLGDQLDALLESVDLATYGLERRSLSTSVKLDEAEAELDPQNPNPRSAHNAQAQHDPLQEIIDNFNNHWFKDWDATPEEKRAKLLNIAQQVGSHADYANLVANNADPQTSDHAFNRIFEEVINRMRRSEDQFNRMLKKDPAMAAAIKAHMREVVARRL